MAQTYLLNEKNWLPTMQRSLKEYIENAIDQYVKNNLNQSSGLEIYEISMDFPSAATLQERMPLPKTIIHFEIDDIDNQLLGFGESIVKEFYDDNGDIVQEEAMTHVVNFDVGIWASDRSGGSTARLIAYQMLQDILNCPSSIFNILDATQGIKAMSFRGGRFLQETINDIRVYRIVDLELQVKVFSRKEVGPFKEVVDIDLDDGIFIQDEVIVDSP